MAKNYLFALIMITISFYSSAQCPTGATFTNQSQVDYFEVKYPNCTTINGDLILDPFGGSSIQNLNALKKITKITGNLILTQHSVGMGNFNGLENLTHIGGRIYINDTWVRDISGLKNLTYVGGDIDISGNMIRDFSPLNNITYMGGSLTLSNDDNYCVTGLKLKVTNIPGNLSYYLNCNSDVNLNALSSVKTVGGDFSLSDERIKNLEGLNVLESVGGTFKLSFCYSLTSLEGINSLKSIGGLNLSYNSELTNLSALNQTTSLTKGLYIYQNNKLNSLTGLHNIKSIGGRFNISTNQALTSINDLSNADFKDLTYLEILSNPSLSLCQELNICNYLFSGRENYIVGNSGGCLNYDKLVESCNIAWKNTITGILKIDIDGNGCGANDLPMAKNIITATNATDKYSTYADANGAYTMYVPTGNYRVESYSPVNYFNLNPNSKSVNFTGVGNKEIVDFCATPSTILNDVKVVIIPSERARPGFEANYTIIYTNSGTTVMNGTLDFSFDDTKMNLINSSTPVTSQKDNKLSWDYANLLPFESRKIFLTFKVLPPPIVNAGNINKMVAIINPLDKDYVVKDNTFTLNQNVVNSFDPNDKLALGGNTILKENVYGYIDYVIRFQNTGTASAINIRIEDVFDKQLTATSLQLTDMSHPGRIQVKNNTAEFIFDNINLPDSKSDEKNSHGYIAFKIPGKYETPVGYIINNKASIYFDYNAPIITNTFSILVGIDTDKDGVIDPQDNCILTPNPDQSDIDNDGVGDICDDNFEVNPPYSIGFDTENLDSFWKTYKQHPTYTSVNVSDLYDMDGSGKTIKLESNPSYYHQAILISPRLFKLATSSQISFWGKSNSSDYTDYTNIVYGFMTNPNNPATFTKIGTVSPKTNMTAYNVDMKDYKPSYGQYFAIRAIGKTFYVDDFKYEDPTITLAVPENKPNLFKLYPNPAEHVLNIESSENSIDLIRIYDLNGKEVKKITPSKNETFLQVQIGNLRTGMYLLEANSGKKKEVQKFIKN